MILGSTNISTLKLGSSAVQKVMLGATEVWSNFDPDFAAYLAAGVANGSTMNAANQTAVNAFIVGCKADGIWSAIKASCLLCAWNSLAGALTPLVGAAPTNNGPFVAGDYSRTAGLIGNASTKYLDSNRNNNADPQNNKSLGVWVSNTFGTNSAQIGSGAATIGSSQIFTGGGVGIFRVNYAGSTNLSLADAAGLWGASRSSSANHDYFSPSGSGAQSLNSAVPLNETINIFRRGNASPSASAARISYYWIGESLNLALLNARLTTLMAALT